MLRTINAREIIEKEVMAFGNGSIVYTPKRWIGEKVLVALEQRPLDIKGEALEALKPHMESIEGIYLFGSYARNEQSEGSDADILVISGKKIPIRNAGKLDFLVRSKEELEAGMKSDPTLFLWQAVKEAKPLLNESLIRELRTQRPAPDFSPFFEDTLWAFRKTSELLDKNKDGEYLGSNAAIYSMMLRLRTMFIIQCHKKGVAFTNKKFAQFIRRHGFGEKTAALFFEAYRAERDEVVKRPKVLLIDAKRLFDAAKLEFLMTEEMAK